MATFVRQTQADAEACIRDFPHNWTQSESHETRTHYVCKSDPAIEAIIGQGQGSMWICDIHNHAK
jgi:hypothetical protein